MNKFYTFVQNNSGGSFDIGDGLDHYVIIEAANANEANERAESIGIYFDGVQFNDEDESIGRDCDCCGDRWNRQYTYGGKDNGTETPMIYDRPAIDGVGGVRIHRKE